MNFISKLARRFVRWCIRVGSSGLKEVRIRMRGRGRISGLWVAAVLLTGSAITAVLILGGYLQAVLVAIHGGERSTIYESLSSMGIESIPPYGEQLQYMFLSPLILCGLTTAIAMAVARSKVQFFVLTALSVGLGWTLIDVTVETEINVGLGVSVLCNFLGGFALALFAYVVLINTKPVTDHAGTSPLARVTVWLLWPAFCLMLLSACAYFALSFFLKMPTMPLSVRLSSPVSGYYSVANADACQVVSPAEADAETSDACRVESVGSKAEKPFQIMRKATGDETRSLQWLGNAKGLSFGWDQRTSGHAGVQFRLSQGCVGKGDEGNPLSFPAFAESQSRSIKVSLDDSLVDFESVSGLPLGEVVLVDEEEPAMFWVLPSKSDSEKLSISRFLSNGTISIDENVGRHDYKFGLYPFTSSDGEVRVEERTINLSFEGEKSLTILVKMNERHVNMQDKMKCEPAPYVVQDSKFIVDATSPYVSLIVSVPPSEPQSFAQYRSNIATLAGINGWVGMEGWPVASSDGYITNGAVTQLSLAGRMDDLQVGERTFEGKVADLRISGDLTGRSKEGSIFFSGEARYLDIDGHRITATRWESLDSAVRTAIVIGVPTSLLFIGNVLISALRRPRKRVWSGP